MKRKTKIATIVVAILAVLAMASVGFASWIITNDAKNEAAGNISVETVENRAITLNASVDSNESLAFVSGTRTAQDDDWLTSDAQDTTAEDLSVVLNIEVSGNFQRIEIAFDTGTMSEGKFTKVTDNNAFNTCVTDKLIATYGVPTIADQTASSGDSAYFTAAADTTDSTKIILTRNSSKTNWDKGADDKLKITLTFTFAWGDHFKEEGDTTGKNPINFYNGHKYADIHTQATTEPEADAITYGEDAITQLKKLEALANYGYQFTVTASGEVNS